MVSGPVWRGVDSRDVQLDRTLGVLEWQIGTLVEGQRFQARMGLCSKEMPSDAQYVFVIPAEAGFRCDLGHLASP